VTVYYDFSYYMGESVIKTKSLRIITMRAGMA